MKADEYVRKFHEYLANPPDIWKGKPKDVPEEEYNPIVDAGIAIAIDMFREGRDLMEKRQSRCNSAVVAILREMYQKYKAVCNRLRAEKPPILIPSNFFLITGKDLYPKIEHVFETLV